MIVDNFNRVHDYLRISLTDNCNLRCFYCMPDEDYNFSPASRLMQADEVLALAQTFVSEGVRKIRLTGGEPLVRKDAAKIIIGLAKLPVELSITTNGTRIHEFLEILENAGLKSINLSLDTLDAEKFKVITRRDLFALVKKNIELLLVRGFQVKINVVLMKGLNDSEINDFIAWTALSPLQVRFIEFMPFSGNRWTSNKVVSSAEILETIAGTYKYQWVPGTVNDTARHYSIQGHQGDFAIISTMTAPFCSGCNRMRLTADGKLKNCLFSNSEVDLLGPLRSGESVLPIIHQHIKSKAEALGGQFTTAIQEIEAINIENRSMISIGG